MPCEREAGRVLEPVSLAGASTVVVGEDRGPCKMDSEATIKILILSEGERVLDLGICENFLRYDDDRLQLVESVEEDFPNCIRRA